MRDGILCREDEKSKVKIVAKDCEIVIQIS